MFRKILCMSIIALTATALTAQNIDEIIEKNIAAKGGYETLKSINTIKATGTFSARDGALSGKFETMQKRPNMVRNNSIIQEQTMVQAYDGETAWWIMPFAGNTNPQLMPEMQANMFKQNADMDGPLVDYNEKGHEVELMGKEDMEGTQVYKVKVTRKDSSIQYFFLDSEYFIELKSSIKRMIQGNEIEAETFYSDYKQVDGIMVPHSIETKANGTTLSQLTIDSVETNLELADSLFKMPEKPEKTNAEN